MLSWSSLQGAASMWLHRLEWCPSEESTVEDMMSVDLIAHVCASTKSKASRTDGK